MSRNYPNMTYCAFENTASALRQVIGLVQDAYEDGMTFGELVESRSSKDEGRAVREIAGLAQELIDMLTDLDHNVTNDLELEEDGA